MARRSNKISSELVRKTLQAGRRVCDSSGQPVELGVGPMLIVPRVETKYGNVRCQDDRGRWFDSKAERRNQLRLESEFDGKVLRQVSLILIDGDKPVRMRIDHMPILETQDDGRFVARFFDTKGAAPTREWENKRRLLLEKMGICVDVLR